MHNKITTLLIFLVSNIALIISLIQFYAPSDDIPLITQGAYYYLVASFILFLLSFFIETPINKILKWSNNLILFLFALCGIFLLLISLYASPIDKPEPYAAAIFFIASMIGGSAIFYNVKDTSDKAIKPIGQIHQYIRYSILIIIIIWVIRFLYIMTTTIINIQGI